MNSRLRKYLASSIDNKNIVEIFEMTRKLNRPFIESRQIEQFFPYVERHLQLDFLFQPTELEYNYFFKEGINQDNIFYCSFNTPKVIPRYYNFPLPDINEKEFRYSKTMIFDLGLDNIISSTENNKIINSKFQPIAIRFDKNYFDTRVTFIELLVFNNSTELIDIVFPLTQTKELTSNFVPEITKICLLNPSDILTVSDDNISKDFPSFTQIVFPEIHCLSPLKISNDELMHGFANFTITSDPVYSIDLKTIKNNNDHSSETILTDSLAISNILEPVFELSETFKNEILVNLPTYQKIGAKFLFNSEFAFFYDQFDLGKELQVVMALKMLLRIRAIKKVLIITSSIKETNVNFIGAEELTGIWQKNLHLFLPDFAFNFHMEYQTFIKNKNSKYIITGLTYEILEETIIRNSIAENYFDIYDCIIIDDFTTELSQLNSLNVLFKNLHQKKLWVLSDYENENYAAIVQNLQPEKSVKCLGRDKSQININGHNTFNYDFFLPLDEQNVSIQNNIFENGCEKLDDVIGLGNIFRFRPNAFQIFQDEQRCLNFVEGTCKSSKTNLLLYHLKHILHREDRVLIYTQYEEGGLLQISQLLDESKIEFVKFHPSDSAQILEQNLLKGEIHNGKLVYLTSLKPNRIKFKFPKVSTLINFDNWWNPATRWSLENSLSPDSNCISVYNYYYHNTIESKVKKHLSQKGFYEKLLFDLLPIDKFYTIFDENSWSNIFKITSSYFNVSPKRTFLLFNMKELVEKTKLLLQNLGFVDLETSANVKDYSFNIRAKTPTDQGNEHVLVKCFFAEHLSSDFVNDIIKNLGKYERASRIFIVTNGTISRTNIVLPSKILLIDGNLLANYLNHFVDC